MTFREAIDVYRGRLGDERHPEISTSIWESMNARELSELVESFGDYLTSADGLGNPWACEVVDAILNTAWREAEAELDEGNQ